MGRRESRFSDAGRTKRKILPEPAVFPFRRQRHPFVPAGPVKLRKRVYAKGIVLGIPIISGMPFPFGQCSCLQGTAFPTIYGWTGTLFGDKICHTRTFPAVFRAYWVIAVPWKS
ncbi:MAG: hypothetical protein BAA03_10020 [Caldibacillus debilis]|nr:MAG: hypothetical protein BAA03_10020 [Caldibacillus debilis]